MIKTIVRFFVVGGCLIGASACSFFGYYSWQEEVKLTDGRVIVVEQKKHADHGIAREAWLTISLSEFSAQPIVWHENLSPLIVNVDGGTLYVVAYTPTVIEFKKYGSPRPFYVGFFWGDGKWNRIPFEKIPQAIYTTNLLIEGFPPKGTTLLTLEKKNSPAVNGEGTLPPALKRLDPRATFD